MVKFTPRPGMARTGHGLQKAPIVNVAYAVELTEPPLVSGGLEGEPTVTFVFKGATEQLLREAFVRLCHNSNGIARGFTIYEDAEPQRRQGCPYRRWNVELTEPDLRNNSVDDMSLQMESVMLFLLNGYRHAKHREKCVVDRYAIDDFLNLSGRDGSRIIHADRSRPAVSQPRPKRSRKQDVPPADATAETLQGQQSQKKGKPMPNIYIRLPWYVAAFYRGLEEDNPLTVWQPIQFKEYTHEWVVLANNLRYLPEQRLSMICLSQRGWSNILRGKKPDGGAVIIQRDPGEWPTIQEICTLEGSAVSNAQRSLDYLAVEMPRVVIQNGRQVKPNSCYALDYDIAFKFRQILCQEFYHVFLDWVEQDERYCNRMGIHRKNLEVMERFLVQYNIPISIENSEQDSLRRMRNRWLANAKKRPNDRINFGSLWLEHISDEERRRAEERQRHANGAKK